MKKISKIIFQESFDPTLKKKVKEFLESGSAASNFTKGILIAAALGGVFAVGVIAPNVLKVFNLKDKRKLNQKGFLHLQRSYYQLRRQRYIEKVNSGKEGEYRLTQDGERFLWQYLLKNIPIPTMRRWDKKWRLVMFDIPNSLRLYRDRFRTYLRNLDCYPVQKSIWAHPFSCQEQIYETARSMGLTKYVDIYVVEDFDNPRALAHFNALLSEIL